MKKTTKWWALALAMSAVLLTSSGLLAQDATEADPEAYTVEFENETVRVLRIRYEAGHQSVMHSHPAGVAVFLTDGKARFTYPDGDSEEVSWNAGDVIYAPAVTHQPENLGDEAFELVQIELKRVEGGDSGE